MFSPRAKITQRTASFTADSGIQSWKALCTASLDSGRIQRYRMNTKTAIAKRLIGQAFEVRVMRAGAGVAARTSPGSVEVATSHLLCCRRTEEALRFEHHEQDQDGEDNGLRPMLTESQAFVDILD